jgi:hypothetical protein
MENIDIHIFIQYVTNVKVENYKIYFNDSFVPNMCTSLQTTLAAEVHLAEGQFLREQTLNIEKSLIYRTGTRRIIGKIILRCVMQAEKQPQSVELGSKIALGGKATLSF